MLVLDELEEARERIRDQKDLLQENNVVIASLLAARNKARVEQTCDACGGTDLNTFIAYTCNGCHARNHG